MSRKRSPENDYICQRCGCPCDPTGTRHLGGGQNMRACGLPPKPILRSEMEAWASGVRDIVLQDLWSK
jgi:hypothetical protein